MGFVFALWVAFCGGAITGSQIVEHKQMKQAQVELVKQNPRLVAKASQCDTDCVEDTGEKVYRLSEDCEWDEDHGQPNSKSCRAFHQLDKD